MKMGDEIGYEGNGSMLAESEGCCRGLEVGVDISMGSCLGEALAG